MNAPILSKKQQKKAFSAKKASREVIKNVLATPYESYWPLISTDELSRLRTALIGALPRIQHDKTNVPWKEIKNIPKNERKIFRHNYASAATNNNVNSTTETVSKPNKGLLVLGVNNVSRLLEKNEASAILIAADVRPRLMVQHLTDQAVLYSVPLLVVNNLRDILHRKCGISSSSMALSKAIGSDEQLASLRQIIEEISEHYPVPTNHINYDRRMRLLTYLGDTIVEEKDNNHSSTEAVIKSDVDEGASRLYLFRANKGAKRAFIPETSKVSDKLLQSRIINNNTGNADSSGFIPFSADKPEEEEEAHTPVSAAASLDKARKNLKSLVVKRLKGNKDRSQMKIDRLKNNRPN